MSMFNRFSSWSIILVFLDVVSSSPVWIRRCLMFQQATVITEGETVEGRRPECARLPVNPSCRAATTLLEEESPLSAKACLLLLNGHHKIVKAPSAWAKFGSRCFPSENVRLRTYTAFYPTERMSVTTGILLGCPAVAYLRCLVLPLTSVDARDYIVPESRKRHLPERSLLDSCCQKNTWSALSRASTRRPLWQG